MSGYSAAVADSAEVIKVYPDYADWLNGRSATAMLAECYRLMYRRVYESCKTQDYHPNQIDDSDVFIRCEVYLFLEELFAGHAIPDSGGGDSEAIKLADYWHKKFEREWESLRWDYDDTVASPSDTTVRQEPVLSFTRGA